MNKNDLQFYFLERDGESFFCCRTINPNSCSYFEWVQKIEKIEKLNSDFNKLLKTLKIFSTSKMTFDDLSVEEYIGEKYKINVIESKKMKDFFNSYYLFKTNSVYEKLLGDRLYIIYKKQNLVY
jgi:hypothetical protein